MKDLIVGFPQQLRDALSIALAVSNPSDINVNIDNILICGLGGSGIGGTLVQNYLSDISPKPIGVHKDYSLPKFVDKNTLVICSSYSGNTEETLDAYQTALQRNAQVYVISSGGKLIERAKKDQIPFIQIPQGMPPRSCLGYSLIQLFRILELNGIIGSGYQSGIKDAVTLLLDESTRIQEEAEQLANKLHGKLPVIYSDNNIEGVTIRWRQQFNENGKILCWHHIIPEMNHNELVGWSEVQDDKSVIFLRNSFENPRSVLRISIVDEIIRKYTNNVYHVMANGRTKLEQMFYLIHFGDWLSLFISENNKVDASEIKVIEYLKSKLEEK